MPLKLSSIPSDLPGSAAQCEGVHKDGNKSSSTSVMATDTSDTACMVCGLSSDPFVVLLCDGCENEAHLACVGLSHVPVGEWFCPSCLSRDPTQMKATHPHTAPTKPASEAHDMRHGPGELDEIDGIMIEAFAEEDVDFRLAPPRQKRHKYRRRSQLQQEEPEPRKRKRSRPRPTARSQSQSPAPPRPFRHQLLVSSSSTRRVDDEDGGISSTRAHGAGAAAAVEGPEELESARRGDAKRVKRKKKLSTPGPCPLDLSDVPMNLPPIPSNTSGSSSRFK